MNLVVDVFIPAIAVGIRLLLFLSPVIREFLFDRPEISTPANSFKRMMEGIELYQRGISPYSGDVFHEVCTMNSVSGN